MAATRSAARTFPPPFIPPGEGWGGGCLAIAMECDAVQLHPMVAPNYAEQRRALAKSIGLGTKRRKTGRK